MLFAVPTDTVRGIGRHLNLKGDRVVLNEALLGVRDVAPVHVVGKTPIVFLAVEEVGNFAAEVLFSLFVVDDPEFGRRLTRPRGCFRFPCKKS